MDKKKKINRKYVPATLTSKQREKQIKSIKDKKDRPKLEGVKSRKSKYTVMAQKYFKGDTDKKNISKVIGVPKKALDEIVQRGEAAYFSSGSRPNVSSVQWGIARMYSVLFGGNARKSDRDIVDKYNIPLLKN